MFRKVPHRMPSRLGCPILDSSSSNLLSAFSIFTKSCLPQVSKNPKAKNLSYWAPLKPELEHQDRAHNRAYTCGKKCWVLVAFGLGDEQPLASRNKRLKPTPPTAPQTPNSQGSADEPLCDLCDKNKVYHVFRPGDIGFAAAKIVPFRVMGKQYCVRKVACGRGCIRDLGTLGE